MCLEVEPGAQLGGDGKPQLDADGRPQLRATLDGNSRIEIVQRPTPPILDEPDAAIGRTPLVLIVWSGARIARVFSVVHFNLRYQRVPLGEGIFRHLFF